MSVMPVRKAASVIFVLVFMSIPLRWLKMNAVSMHERRDSSPNICDDTRAMRRFDGQIVDENTAERMGGASVGVNKKHI
jgi:hypothetical protein